MQLPVQVGAYCNPLKYVTFPDVVLSCATRNVARSCAMLSPSPVVRAILIITLALNL
jgi:hypothetical protein